MILNFNLNSHKNIAEEAFSGIENWCKEFNDFALTFFMYMKFVFVFILISLGILTLLKLRKVYFDIRVKKPSLEEDPLKNERLILGVTYIFLGIGILFNYLTYFLIWALDPIPDRFIFRFINFNGNINPEHMNRIKDIEGSKYPHERTLYYCFAFGSFVSFLDLFMSFWMFLNNRGVNKPRRTLKWMTSSLIGCILFGFTTFLPFFL